MHSSNIIRMIKSKRMRWVEHVAHMVGKRNVCRILLDNLKRKIMWEMCNGMNVTKAMPED